MGDLFAKDIRGLLKNGDHLLYVFFDMLFELFVAHLNVVVFFVENKHICWNFKLYLFKLFS